MEDTLRFIVEKIVDHPEDIQIIKHDENGKIILEIVANHEDYGKIIGKSGRIIKAIRDIMKIVAVKMHAYIDIVIRDEYQTPTDPA
jgi:uncharacterized protein